MSRDSECERGLMRSAGLWKECRRYSFTFRRSSALVITETELKLMAAAAKIGLSRIPKNG